MRVFVFKQPRLILRFPQGIEALGFDFYPVSHIQDKYKTLIQQARGFDFEIFKMMIRDFSLQFKRQEGRFYVLLTLDEAEHLRGIMHGRSGFSLLPSETTSSIGRTTAAMWVMGDSDVTLLGSTRGYSTAPAPQHSSMTNSFRFLNSDVYFDDRSLTVLLRILEESSCEEREKWWMDVRSCRRRRQIGLDGAMPVTTVFTTANEYQFMEYKAVVSRIQHELQERGMLVFDAFRAFNSSNTGLMTCSELYGGVDFLGIPFTPEQIYDLVRRLATDADVIYIFLN